MNKVKRISHSPRPLETVIEAYRKCYQSEDKSDSEDYSLGPKDELLLKQAMSNGHESPLEHVSVTFDIIASRICQTQIIRHRIASYSIESMRYCKPKGFHSPDLPEILKGEYTDLMEECWKMYNKFIDAGVKKDEARYVLPMATLGEIRMTMNLRELRHFIAERTCKNASTEMRQVALKVKESVACIHPIFVFRCEKFWRCIAADQCKYCLGV